MVTLNDAGGGASESILLHGSCCRDVMPGSALLYLMVLESGRQSNQPSSLQTDAVTDQTRPQSDSRSSQVHHQLPAADFVFQRELLQT